MILWKYLIFAAIACRMPGPGPHDRIAGAIACRMPGPGQDLAEHSNNVNRYHDIDIQISNTPGDIHGPHPMAEGVPSVSAKNKKGSAKIGAKIKRGPLKSAQNKKDLDCTAQTKGPEVPWKNNERPSKVPRKNYKDPQKSYEKSTRALKNRRKIKKA